MLLSSLFLYNVFKILYERYSHKNDKRIKALAEEKGDKLEIVSAGRIKTLQNELQKLNSETELNSYHKWVVNKLYSFKIPDKMRSVIIVAVPHPAYANVIFNRNGKEYKAFGTVPSLLDKTKKYIVETMKKAGYEINAENRLPLKRLAVQSGLAKYGRNNITYVDGMGSYLAYVAFSTDMPCGDDSWRDVIVSEECADCEACINNCPMGAISKNNFIIDPGRCLSYYNENKEDFPEWLPSTAHHTAYDCLKCQTCCPMNANCKETINVFFDEAETERLIGGKPYKDASKELKNKIKLLELDKWASIPRNLTTLFECMEEGHIPSL